MNSTKSALTKTPRTFPLWLAALGVVYGDIGTSPLYALKSCFVAAELAVTAPNILGVISLFIWVLILTVTLKYVCLVMRFDNQGEGGILVLATLCSKLKPTKHYAIALSLGIFGGALFFSDGIITPAISVLGALEGIELVKPTISAQIPWLATVIITILFLIQKQGSGKIGDYFGPIMLLWFLTIAFIGFRAIHIEPGILAAFNPYYAYHLLFSHYLLSLTIIGIVILVITGAEALYADIGHFGKSPIRYTWLWIVLPCLLLNYLGQGALLLKDPSALANPFYLLVAPQFLYALIALSTIASIIASQSIISGVFSLAWQAIMLNFLPRMQVFHTSNLHIGQIYIPVVNYLLYGLTLWLIWKFENTENLASAYGLSVAGVMFITTCLSFLLVRYQLKWSLLAVVAIFVPLFMIDSVFIMANLLKITHGAWYPLLISCVLSYLVWVWRKGVKARLQQTLPTQVPLPKYLAAYEVKNLPTIPTSAIFLSHITNSVPNSLRIFLQHNKYLPQKMIFIEVVITPSPKVAMADKFSLQRLNDHTFQLTTYFGFQEIPDIGQVIHWVRKQAILAEKEEISLYFSKSIAVASAKPMLRGLSEKLYILLAKNALSSQEFYKIPSHVVVELGIRYQV